MGRTVTLWYVKSRDAGNKERIRRGVCIQIRVSGRGSWKKSFVKSKLILPLPGCNPSVASHYCQDRPKHLLSIHRNPQICHVVHPMFLLLSPTDICQILVQSLGFLISSSLCEMCADPSPGPGICCLIVLLAILVSYLFSCMSIWDLVSPCTVTSVSAAIWSCQVTTQLYPITDTCLWID